MGGNGIARQDTGQTGFSKGEGEKH